MYHNDNPNRIEAHDDVEEVLSAELDENQDVPLLTVRYRLRPGNYSGKDLQLHSTNGVNHRYEPVTRLDAPKNLKEPGSSSTDEGSEEIQAKPKKGK
jgi:hypothetical protein